MVWRCCEESLQAVLGRLQGAARLSSSFKSELTEMTVLVNCFTTNEPLDLQEKSECPVIQEQLVLGELELMDYSWFSQACMVSSDK